MGRLINKKKVKSIANSKKKKGESVANQMSTMNDLIPELFQPGNSAVDVGRIMTAVVLSPDDENRKVQQEKREGNPDTHAITATSTDAKSTILDFIYGTDEKKVKVNKHQDCIGSCKSIWEDDNINESIFDVNDSDIDDILYVEESVHKAMEPVKSVGNYHRNAITRIKEDYRRNAITHIKEGLSSGSLTYRISNEISNAKLERLGIQNGRTGPTTMNTPKDTTDGATVTDGAIVHADLATNEPGIFHKSDHIPEDPYDDKYYGEYKDDDDDIQF